MREAQIEERLRDGVKAMGGKAYKFVSPGNDGVPDRIVFLPGGCVYICEMKQPGKKPTPLQQHQIDTLRALGQDVRVLDSIEAVGNFLAEIKGGEGNGAV